MKLKRIRSFSTQRGFSSIELLLVTVIITVLTAIEVPQALEMMHLHRLSNATRQFSGLVHQARSSSVKDSNSYSVYFIAAQPITEAFIGVKGTMFDYVYDPLTTWHSEVAPKAASSAPATASLETAAFLSGSGTTGSGLTVVDGYVTSISSGKGITFSALGSPCLPATSGSASICNMASSSTSIAYWVFFQNSQTQAWQAVTVTPAGRVQRWYYNNSWNAI